MVSKVARRHQFHQLDPRRGGCIDNKGKKSECTENPYLSRVLAHMGTKLIERKTLKYRFVETSQ